MSKVFMNKRKTVTAIVAVVMCVLIIFGGTFAWQSISQEALNEVSALRNPGGRLHDDFVDITDEIDPATGKPYKTMTFNKDVYVENFTSYASNGVQVFARVRLDEYMEFGLNAGVAGNNTATSLVFGAELDDKSTWTTYVPGADSVYNAENPFSEYWKWDIITDKANADAGSVIYMPTYNKNKDSLEADINGTFDADFTDHTDYTDPDNATKNYYEIVDNDDNTTDELDNEHVDLNAVIKGDQVLSENYDQHVTVSTEKIEHTVDQSLSAYVITMDEWLKLPADEQRGNFWVWDRDGWAYWANPVNPETATGVLLSGISRQENVINEDWYYAINVVAQFVTKEDLGKENGTGFYDTTDGISKAPTNNALILLNAIGVDVNTTVADGDADGLKNALSLGGNIILDGTYSSEANYTSLGADYPMSFVWSSGGTLNGGTLVSTTDKAFAGLFINAEEGWPATTDGATAAIANNVTVKGNLRSGIYAQAIGEDITLNLVTVENTYGVGIYAEHGTGKVTLNGCTVTAPTTDTGANDWMLSAVAAAGGANIVINGGDYTGKYAAYVYSSGGSITILDGNFNGELKADNGTLTVKGGTFTVDPTQYVDLDNYTVTFENGVYTVN